MAKQQIEDEQEFVTMKVPRDMWRRIGVIAEFHNMNRPEVLAKYASGPIDREYGRVVSVMDRDLGGEG